MVRTRRQQPTRRDESAQRDALEAVDMHNITVGQYLDKFLQSEWNALWEAWKKCEEKFSLNAKKVEEEVMLRAQAKYSEFDTRRSKA